METLIQITTDAQGASVVSARDLHQFLAVKARFNDWFTRRSEKYGLIENRDFVLVTQNRVTNNPRNPTAEVVDYALTLDTAKELAMVEGNEQGKAARTYFIDCESRLRAIVNQTPPAVAPATDPLLLQILQNQSQLMVDQQSQLNQLRADIAQIQAGSKPPRSRPRSATPSPTHFSQWRQEVNQYVNQYCEYYGYVQGEAYRHLYKTLLVKFGIDVYRYPKYGNESLLDVIERYGHLEKLHYVAWTEFSHSKQ